MCRRPCGERRTGALPGRAGDWPAVLGRRCGAGLNVAATGYGEQVPGGSTAAVAGPAWEAPGVRREARRCSTCCEAADCEVGEFLQTGSPAMLKMGSTVRICKQVESQTRTHAWNCEVRCIGNPRQSHLGRGTCQPLLPPMNNQATACCRRPVRLSSCLKGRVLCQQRRPRRCCQ